MKRETIGEIVFWSAVGFALALYALTAPTGLPWSPAESNRYWRYLVAMADGSAVVLTSVLAAVAAGLLGAVVNRYFGWRVGVAAALVWMILPWVWNRAITGGRGLVVAAAAIAVLWVANAVFLFATRKALATRKARRMDLESDAAAAHDVQMRRARTNRKASWSVLGAAVLFAIVSASMHDYRLGEAASAYARLVVGEAGDRIVIANGVADEQIGREVGIRNEELGMKDKSAIRNSSFIVLRSDAAYRAQLVEWAKREWPAETNLWVAAQIGSKAFAEVAVKTHPERFYVMTGRSTTPEKWLARWAAMKAYLSSGDPFIPVLRRAFAYEGNALGNGLQEAGKLKEAWQIYYRVFDEIEPRNPAACVNLNEMLRRGYATDAGTRQRVESAQADFAKLLKDRRKAVETAARIAMFGPVMRDEKAYEKLRAEAAARMAELEREGKRLEPSPELRTLEEWHAEMMKAYYAKELDKAAAIARAILSRPRWRGFIPANLVMGTDMAARGDYVAAEAFYRVAIAGKGAAAPAAFVYNDYAEVLRILGRYDEAERYSRKAVENGNEKAWVFRLTLAQVLRDKSKVQGPMPKVQSWEEIRMLVNDVLKHAPAEVRRRVRKEFPQ